MPNMNYTPKKVAHRALARHTTDLNALVDEAIDALDTASKRERVLDDGEAERRADLAQTFPALNREH